jgi:hypothetical protein
MFFPIARAREVLLAYSRWITSLPNEWTTAAVLLHLPPAPFIPEPLRGQSLVNIRGCYTGSAADGEDWLSPMRELGGAVLDTFGPMSFRDVATISNDPLAPSNSYGQTEVLADLSAETIDALIAAVGTPPDSPLLFAEVRHMGGAVNQTPAASSAFGHRDMRFILFMIGLVTNPERDIALARHMRTAKATLQPHITGQTYLNFLGDTDGGAARVRAAYKPDTYARLVALKNRYDPTNMLRFNRNIPPSYEQYESPLKI